MYFMGKLIPIDNIRSIVADIMSNIEDLLWDSLIFKESKDIRFAIPLASIKDDLTQT